MSENPSNPSSPVAQDSPMVFGTPHMQGPPNLAESITEMVRALSTLTSQINSLVEHTLQTEQRIQETNQLISTVFAGTPNTIPVRSARLPVSEQQQVETSVRMEQSPPVASNSVTSRRVNVQETPTMPAAEVNMLLNPVPGSYTQTPQIGSQDSPDSSDTSINEDESEVSELEERLSSLGLRTKRDRRSTWYVLPRRSNKRKSFIERNIAIAENPSDSNTTNKVSLTKVQPDYSKIKLWELTPLAVMNFYDEVIEFETTTQSTIYPVASLIRKSIRRSLASRTEGDLTEYSLLKMEFKDLMGILIKFTAPHSRLEFIFHLEKCARFPILKDYRPSLLNFQTWHGMVLEFMDDFKRAFEFLSESYDDTKYRLHVPLCNNKENGLVKLFCKNVPFEYATRVVTSWDQHTFKDIYKFLAKFTKDLTNHHNLSIQVGQNKFNFGGTQYTSLFSSSRNVEKLRPTTFPSKTRSSLHNLTPTEAYGGTLASVDHALEEELYISVHDTQDDSQELTEVQESPLEIEDDDLYDALADMDAIDTNPVDEKFSQNNELSQALAYMQRPPEKGHSQPFVHQQKHQQNKDAQQKQPQVASNGCFKMTIFGSCDKGNNCRFSHHPAALAKARADLTTRLQRNPNAPNQNPIQNRPKY